MTAERSERRGRRARAVRGLAVLLEPVAGPGSERRRALSWSALDGLPDWCGLDRRGRAERCALAGAVALLPAIRRCLDGRTLLPLSRRIGAGRFEALRRRPYRAFVRDETRLAITPGPALDRQLLELGVRALVSEVADPAVRALLHDALRVEHGLDGADGLDGGGEDGAHEPVDVEAGAAAVAAELHAVPVAGAAPAPAAAAAS